MLTSGDDLDAVWQIAQRDYRFGKGKHSSLTKATYDAIGARFRGLWGKEAGWAHSVLFAADLRTFADRLVVKTAKVQVKQEGHEVEAEVEEEEVGVKTGDVKVKIEKERLPRRLILHLPKEEEDADSEARDVKVETEEDRLPPRLYLHLPRESSPSHSTRAVKRESEPDNIVYERGKVTVKTEAGNVEIRDVDFEIKKTVVDGMERVTKKLVLARPRSRRAVKRESEEQDGGVGLKEVKAEMGETAEMEGIKERAGPSARSLRAKRRRMI